MHWLPNSGPRKGLRFHVDTLLLNELQSPPRTLPYSEGTHCYFGESCDHLHFAEYVLPRFNIYELPKDYSEWFVKYRVDLSNLIAQNPRVKKKKN